MGVRRSTSKIGFINQNVQCLPSKFLRKNSSTHPALKSKGQWFELTERSTVLWLGVKKKKERLQTRGEDYKTIIKRTFSIQSSHLLFSQPRTTKLDSDALWNSSCIQQIFCKAQSSLRNATRHLQPEPFSQDPKVEPSWDSFFVRHEINFPWQPWS